jgi:hypothetical protein
MRHRLPRYGAVLEYLGRYTHRVAISNNRLRAFNDGAVTFAWKDYRHESRNKTMTLDAHEFIRRFLLHVLPLRFQRIRHYGLLANRYDQLTLQSSASVGVTFYPQAQDIDADQLFRQADQAMYQAKLAGKNRYHVFDAAQDRTLRGQHESIGRIRVALARREFVLF